MRNTHSGQPKDFSRQQVRLSCVRRALGLCAMSALSLLFLGCADQLYPNPLDAEAEARDLAQSGSNSADLPPQSGNFRHFDGPRGAHRTTVDATSYDTFQRLDLDTGEADGTGWDLAIRRFLILSNGGVSGDGGVQLLKLHGTSFESLTQAPGPDASWEVDQLDGAGDEDTDPDNVFNNGVDDWFEYDLTDHSLTPRDITYVVLSDEGRFYKLKIENYYDDVGTSGILSFLWAEVDAPAQEVPDQDLPDGESPVPDPEDPIDPTDPEPESSGIYTVKATSYENFVYVSLDAGAVTISDPQASTDWDLAFRRYVILTNSGTSGPGMGGALLDTSGLAHGEIKSAPADGYVIDEILPASGAPGSTEGTANAVLEPWYDYQGLGALTPKNQTFLIRTAEGAYAKLLIQSYVGGTFTISFLPL